MGEGWTAEERSPGACLCLSAVASVPRSLRDRELTDLLGFVTVSTFSEVGSAPRRLMLDALRAPPHSSAQHSRGALLPGTCSLVGGGERWQELTEPGDSGRWGGVRPRLCT